MPEPDSYEVSVVEVQRHDTAGILAKVRFDEVSQFVGGGLAELYSSLASQASTPYLRSLGIGAESMDLELGVIVTEPVTAFGRVHPSQLPGGLVAIATHVGPYCEVVSAYQAVERWVAEHGYTIVGAPWEYYLDGPEVANPRTEVYFPVEARS